MIKKEIELSMGEIIPVVTTIAIAGLVAAFTLQVVGETRDDFYADGAAKAGCNSTAKTACDSDYNASVDTVSGIAKLPEKLPTIGLVAAASIIIGLLLSFFVKAKY